MDQGSNRAGIEMTDEDLKSLLQRLWSGLPPDGTDLNDFTETETNLLCELLSEMKPGQKND